MYMPTLFIFAALLMVETNLSSFPRLRSHLGDSGRKNRGARVRNRGADIQICDRSYKL